MAYGLWLMGGMVAGFAGGPRIRCRKDDGIPVAGYLYRNELPERCIVA